MKNFPVMLLVVFVAASCGESDVEEKNESVDAAADTSTSGADAAQSDAASAGADATESDIGVTPCKKKEGKIGELSFGPPLAWTKPLLDYHKVGFQKAPSGKFLQGVQDLAVFEGRLYIGYGDANINLGSLSQLSIRYFESCDATTPKDEFKHDEEQIDRFRHLGDELWVPGVDATQDGWLGNVYRREKGKDWVKLRTVGSGVHVHDVARFGGELYAVGSGNTKEGWKQGDVYGFLWRSKDDGKTFAPVDKVWNETTGDARLLHLLPAGGRLYAFGYHINNKGQLKSVPNRVWDGKEATYLPPGHPLQLTFIRNCWPTTEDSGVVIGQDLLESNNPPMRAWHIAKDKTEVLAAFNGRVVVDVFTRRDTAETLLLSRPGSQPAPPKNGEKTDWQLHLTSDFKTFVKVLDFPATTNIESVGFWQGGLYLGTALGGLYRSEGE